MRIVIAFVFQNFPTCTILLIISKRAESNPGLMGIFSNRIIANYVDCFMLENVECRYY